MELGSSNVHVLLRYRLKNFQSYLSGRWSSNLEFFTLKKHEIRLGSVIWNSITTVQKIIRDQMTCVRPIDIEELLSCSL